MSAAHPSIADYHRAERKRAVECGGHVASWLDRDGTLNARCSRCGRGSRWTPAEVAAWGMTAGASFAPCDAVRHNQGK